MGNKPGRPPQQRRIPKSKPRISISTLAKMHLARAKIGARVTIQGRIYEKVGEGKKGVVIVQFVGND